MTTGNVADTLGYMVLEFCGLMQKPEMKNRERGVVA
jgi:hypothetical protein